MLTFALKTEFAEGDNGSAIEVIELDCAEARFRRVSASVSKRNGEMSREQRARGVPRLTPEGSVMAQIAVPLCGGWVEDEGRGVPGLIGTLSALLTGDKEAFAFQEELWISDPRWNLERCAEV